MDLLRCGWDGGCVAQVVGVGILETKWAGVREERGGGNMATRDAGCGNVGN